MRTTEAMHVLVEIHHLEAIELLGNLLNFLLLIRLDGFDALGVPVLRISKSLILKCQSYHRMYFPDPSPFILKSTLELWRGMI